MTPVIAPGTNSSEGSYPYLNDLPWTGTAGDGFRFFFPDVE